MLTPRSETNLSQRRRSQSLAGKYLLGTQRDFSSNFHRFGLSVGVKTGGSRVGGPDLCV